MSTIKNNPHVPSAALKLPGTLEPLLATAEGILKAMTGNASFPSPSPPLATLQQAIADLRAAQAVVKTGLHGSTVSRDDKRAALAQLLRRLRGYVQGVAAADPSTASAVILSAGMAVGQTARTRARVFHAKTGPLSGSAVVYSPTAGTKAAYAWEYSLDGGKTWVIAPTTLTSKTTITGLPVGTTVLFRCRFVTKSGEGNWSQAFALTVQ